MTYEKQNCSPQPDDFENQQEPFANGLYGVSVSYACSWCRSPGRCRWPWQIVTILTSIAVGMAPAGLAPGSKTLLASSHFQTITSNMVTGVIQIWLVCIVSVTLLQVIKIEKDCFLCSIAPFLLFFSYSLALYLGNGFISLIRLGCSCGVGTASQPS